DGVGNLDERQERVLRVAEVAVGVAEKSAALQEVLVADPERRLEEVRAPGKQGVRQLQRRKGDKEISGIDRWNDDKREGVELPQPVVEKRVRRVAEEQPIK